MLLEREHPFLSITIIDETFQTEEKHLCFIRNKHIPERFIKKEWNRISMKDIDGNEVKRSLSNESYKLLDWVELQRDTLQLCKNHAHVNLIKGRIQDIEECDEHVLITLDNDKSVEADKLYNSVVLNPSKSDLIQQFKGAIVELDQDTFDPSEVRLMDFHSHEQDEHVEFRYDLPYSARKALIEYTVITTTPMSRALLDARFNNLLSQFNHNYSLSSVECGAIPMPTSQRAIINTSKIFNIGLAGGFQRRSSGYLLQTVHDEVKHWLDFLNDPTPLQAKKEKLKEYLDTVFLSVIKANPSLAQGLFLSMFRGTSGDQFLKFMFNSISWKTALPIVLSLPKTPFLKHAAVHIKGLL